MNLFKQDIFSEEVKNSLCICDKNYTCEQVTLFEKSNKNCQIHREFVSNQSCLIHTSY